MVRVLIATSNPGKLRDFAGAAAVHGVEVQEVPGFDSLPQAVEDGTTFEANARKKAEHYSRLLPEEMVLADDSGLEVDRLAGAPGVHSARYAAAEGQDAQPGAAVPLGNSDDAANNARLLRDLGSAPGQQRSARFVCVIAAARGGRILASFRGTVEGRILMQPRGRLGFGYDPLFFYSPLGRTFGELTPQEKAGVSHRGRAFARFLEWFESGQSD